MKIATLNIDWGRKAKSKNHYIKIQNFLSAQNFDFLVLTEAIDLVLPNYSFKYFSEMIPENIVYEKLNYTDYLNGAKAYRTAIYSNYSCFKQYQVEDSRTAMALEFQIDEQSFILYASIIGTRFKEKPYAQVELVNFIKDCEQLYAQNSHLIIAGDFNTSFLENEKDYQINAETTSQLKCLFEKFKLHNATSAIAKNIDHIIIPESLKESIINFDVFVEKDVLSDHQGVFVDLEWM